MIAFLFDYAGDFTDAELNSQNILHLQAPIDLTGGGGGGGWLSDINYTASTHFIGVLLTDDDEGVVNVDTSEAIGGFADVRPGILRLHLLDLEAQPEDAEADPAAVDVAAVLGPHDERGRVSVHGAGQLDGAPQPGALPVGHLVGHLRGTWEAGGGATTQGKVRPAIEGSVRHAPNRHNLEERISQNG